MKMLPLFIAGLTALLSIEGAAHAATFPLPPPGTDVVGRIQTTLTRPGDTLLDIARRYDLGYNEITEANPGIDPWLPGDRTRVVLPTQFILPDAPRRGIVLDVAAMRLYYYPVPRAGERPVVMTYPIGIGRLHWRTPLGVTRVVSRVVKPVWHVPPSIRREHARDGNPLPEYVAPGPDNPLGEYALLLRIRGYLIHGTNEPYGAGRRVSHGCVRLNAEDIAELFAHVEVGTRVEFVDQPYLAGWRNGHLYLEAHQPLAETRQEFASDLTDVVRIILKQTENRPSQIDWEKAMSVAEQARSLPVQISSSARSQR